MSQVVIGLTGGIGSGKSAAADRFASHGIDIVDADIASRKVVEPGQPALAEIADHFGHHILLADGQLDRAGLRQRIFSEPDQRHWLQSLLHPKINQYLREHIHNAHSAYVMLVNPLLIETQQHLWCQRVLVIDAPEALQLSRTMARDNNSQAQVENIMRAQAERQQRLRYADDTIVNDRDLSYLHQQVDKLHEVYMSQLAVLGQTEDTQHG